MRFLRRDSHKKSTKEKVKDILGGNKIDFLFIDGDHTYQGVKRDWEMYSPLVSADGILAFHDIVPRDTTCGVDSLWKNIKKDFDYREIVEDWNSGQYGIGVLFLGGAE